MPSSNPKSRRKPRPRNVPQASTQRPDASWSMYPALNENVQSLLEEAGLTFAFFEVDDANGSVEDYDTNIKGAFDCPNQGCRRARWTSMVIPITIRLYPGQRYNARVYHQRCKGCQSLGQPILDESYAERIAYRLKKWSGMEMERRPHSFRDMECPHETALCEGCKHGHCKQGRLWVLAVVDKD